jgi:hypothetical protein
MKHAVIRILNTRSVTTQRNPFEEDSSTADTARIICTAYRLFISSDRTQIGGWLPVYSPPDLRP